MTDPGQRILPGADLGREVPLPPQPPPESDHLCSNCDSDSLQCAGCGVNIESWTLAAKRPVESPDLPIPAEARKAVSEALDGHIMGWHGAKGPACGCGWHPTRVHWAAEHRDHVVEALLAAALPHLRSLQVETQIEFGRALGQREAGEQVVEAFLNAARGDETGLYLDIDTACALAREAAKGDPNG